MRTVVLGLDCASPDIVLGDERLTHLRMLMEGGCWGRLRTVVPPITVPAWMSLATSLDPGTLGVYGFHNRADHSYAPLRMANADDFSAPTIWDHLAADGRRATLVGVPPSFPPRPLLGRRVGCFLTPRTDADVTYTWPAELRERIERVVAPYPVDVSGYRSDDKERLCHDIFDMSRKQCRVARELLRDGDWDYFHFVDIGLDRIQHAFWRHHDSRHRAHEPGHRFANVVNDYYLHLDEQIGEMLRALDGDTAVLVCSDHGVRPLDGGFCVNEWLRQAGLLVFENPPQGVMRLEEAAVDWRRTQVWAEGGYYGRIFLNVAGREPHGTIAPADYENCRQRLKHMLEATVDEAGAPLGTRVFLPQDIYREVNGVAPDLLVYFGDLAWRAIGTVGWNAVHIRHNDTGPDDCNHDEHGVFILAAPQSPLRGEQHGVSILDVAPTLLELNGCAIPSQLQGRSLLGGQGVTVAAPGPLRVEPDAPGSRAAPEDEQLVRDRLSGLGYLG